MSVCTMLRETFGRRSDKVTGGWIKLYNEGLYNLYPSLNIIRLTNQRRMCSDNHATLMEKIRNTAKPQ
jgi:hypothetical protein